MKMIVIHVMPVVYPQNSVCDVSFARFCRMKQLKFETAVKCEKDLLKSMQVALLTNKQ